MMKPTVHAPTPNEIADARAALHRFFVVTQAMAAVVDGGRLDTAYDDVVQHYACLLKLFVAQLDGCYGALADLIPTDHDGRTV